MESEEGSAEAEQSDKDEPPEEHKAEQSNHNKPVVAEQSFEDEPLQPEQSGEDKSPNPPHSDEDDPGKKSVQASRPPELRRSNNVVTVS